MNNPESITVSLEMAKKLRDAGWEKQTWTLWADDEGEWAACCCQNFAGDTIPSDTILFAPTAEEILRELPPRILIRKGTNIDFYSIRWTNPENLFQHFEEENTLANAAAAMWIYLKENNLLPTKK